MCTYIKISYIFIYIYSRFYIYYIYYMNIYIYIVYFILYIKSYIYIYSYIKFLHICIYIIYLFIYLKYEKNKLNIYSERSGGASKKNCRFRHCRLPPSATCWCQFFAVSLQLLVGSIGPPTPGFKRAPAPFAAFW